MNWTKNINALGKVYSILSINVVTIFIIIIVLNLMVASVIQVRGFFKDSLPSMELQSVYPKMTSSDISLLLEETWGRTWQYEPWVGFKEIPRSGKFVNISSEGFRYTHKKDLALTPNGINIYFFGGSTTFGYGVSDVSTIPAHLERYLLKRYPEKDINIFNFGRGYYYSSQELALLTQLIVNNHIPEIAIFVDGLNEGQVEPHYTKELAHMFDAYNMNPSHLLGDFVSKTSLVKSINSLIRSMPNQGVNESVYDVNYVYKRYLKNKEAIKALSEKFNFQSYFFIQPIPGYRNDFSNHMFLKNAPEKWVKNEVSKMELLEKTVNDHVSFSLTDLLDNYGDQPFVDNVHYTSDVCSLIAQKISQKIIIRDQDRL